MGPAVKLRNFYHNYIRTLRYQPAARVNSRAQTLRTYFRHPSTYLHYRYHPADMRKHRYRHQQCHQTYVSALPQSRARFFYQFSARARHRR